MFRRLHALVLVGALTLAAAAVAAPTGPVHASGPEAVFYLSPTGDDGSGDGSSGNPWQTVAHARDYIRTHFATQTGDVDVLLKDGTYPVTSTIEFGSSDSGKNGYDIVYAAAPGAHPVLSGGTDLSGGWSLFDATKGIYRKTGVTGDFRQLYVQNSWAIRAREPNLTDDSTGAGYDTATNSASPFTVPAADIGTWADDGSTEFVWVNHWSQNRAVIAGYTVSGATATIDFASPESGFAVDHHNQGTTPFFFENAYALLDAAGEWFHDTATSSLYYKPRPGENLSTASIVAPSVDTIVSLDGTTGSQIHDLTFSGIAFEHSNWTAPNDYGYVPIQGGQMIQTSAGSDTTDLNGSARFTPAPGMISLSHATGITVERDDFAFAGAWGIVEREGSDHNTYRGNSFTDIASGAIVIGNASSAITWDGLPTGTGAYDVVSDNLIDHSSYYYQDATAIAALKTQHVTIEHNEIRDTGWAAITVGFEWNISGDQNAHDNTVAYNRIDRAMSLLDDGGAVYVLSPQPDSTISDNFVTSIVASPYSGGNTMGGIYLDCATRYYTVDDNVLDLVPKPFVTNDNGGTGDKSEDNKARGNYYAYFTHANSLVDNGFTTGSASAWSGNSDVTGADWPTGAVAIMAAAGVEPAYDDIGAVTHGSNVAIAGTASASSEYSGGFTAGNAIDNDPEVGLWASDAVQSSPWWQVDLGTAQRIYEFQLVARQDGDATSSRTDFEVWASNTSDFSSHAVLGGLDGTAPFADRGIFSTHVVDATAYRYVRVQRINGTGHLNFAQARVFGAPSGSSPPPADDSVAHWNFDSDWSDVSGNGHSLTAYGDAFLDAADTHEGAASASLDGSGDYAASSLVTTATDDVSVSAWVKWGGTTGGHQQIVYNGNTGSSGFGIFLNHGAGDALAILCGGVNVLQSSVTLSTTAWTSVIAVRRSGTWELWVDGSQVSISNTGTSPATPAGGTYVGANQAGAETFSGHLDDVRLFDEPLTSTEIAVLATP